MPMLLIHGDDIHKSRDFLYKTLQRKTNKNTQLIRLDGTKLKVEDFIQATQSDSLFHQKKLILLDSLSKHKSPKTKKFVLKELGQRQDNANIEVIIWEPKKANTSLLKLFNPNSINEFKPNSKIFIFLDELRPNNQQKLTQLYTELTQTEPPEMIFYMICKHLSELIQLKLETFKGPAWKQKKLSRQLHAFQSDSLSQWVSSLLSIEYQVKSGQSAQKLNQLLPIMLMTI